MASSVNQRDTLPGALRSGDVRLKYQERLVARANLGSVVVNIPSEVEINTDDPIGHNPVAELWFDPDAVLPDVPPVEVPSEVEVSTTEPTNPDAELWFDPDAPTDPLQSVNEVFIGDVAPTDPNVELWFSPSAVLP